MIDHFLDIFSKLVIGVLSFVAPVTSYLLSTYIGDRERILNRLQEQSKTSELILSKEVELGVKPGITTSETIKQWNKSLVEFETETKRSVELLTFLAPKKRIFTIFGTLLTSIFLLLVNSLVRENVANCYNHFLSMYLILGSILAFVVALIHLKKIAWALIDAKGIIVKESTEISKVINSVNLQQAVSDVFENQEAIPIN